MRYFQPPADTRFYAGVDLHARALFLSILDHGGEKETAMRVFGVSARAYALRAVRKAAGIKESRDADLGSRALLSRCRGHQAAVRVHPGWAPHCGIRRC